LFCQLIWLKLATREQDKSTSSSRLVSYTQQIHKIVLDEMSQLTYIDLDKILAPISNCTICGEVITTAELHESYVIARMSATSAAIAFATGVTPVACNSRLKNHPVLFAG
jgi:hypothetical protein